jgi:hypothetical protein
MLTRMNCSDTVTPRNEDAMKNLAKGILVLFLNINLVSTTQRSWDSIVGIMTGYGMDDREVGAPVPVR